MRRVANPSVDLLERRYQGAHPLRTLWQLLGAMMLAITRTLVRDPRCSVVALDHLAYAALRKP